MQWLYFHNFNLLAIDFTWDLSSTTWHWGRDSWDSVKPTRVFSAWALIWGSWDSYNSWQSNSSWASCWEGMGVCVYVWMKYSRQLCTQEALEFATTKHYQYFILNHTHNTWYFACKLKLYLLLEFWDMQQRKATLLSYNHLLHETYTLLWSWSNSMNNYLNTNTHESICKSLCTTSQREERNTKQCIPDLP